MSNEGWANCPGSYRFLKTLGVIFKKYFVIWLYGYTFVIMGNEKRIARAYKITDKAYQKAMRRASKEKLQLATMIEVWVVSYGRGLPYFIEGLKSKSQNEYEDVLERIIND